MEYIPEPRLPYAKNALEPHLSAETLEYHHGKHHMAYYNKLKDLTKGLPPKTLEEVIKSAEAGSLLNQAGQLYNHAFYWRCMAPNAAAEGVRKPTGAIAEVVDKEFGSFEAFKTKFDQMAAAAFGSGWVFLVRESGHGATSKVKLVEMHDGDCPLKHGLQPILCIDLWEHAYYIDYRNKRPDYITAWWSLVDWNFCNTQLQGTQYNYQKDN